MRNICNTYCVSTRSNSSCTSRWSWPFLYFQIFANLVLFPFVSNVYWPLFHLIELQRYSFEIRALSSLWRKSSFLILLSVTQPAAFILGFPVHSHTQNFAFYGSSRILEIIMGLGSESQALWCTYLQACSLLFACKLLCCEELFLQWKAITIFCDSFVAQISLLVSYNYIMYRYSCTKTQSYFPLANAVVTMLLIYGTRWVLW